MENVIGDEMKESRQDNEMKNQPVYFRRILLGDDQVRHTDVNEAMQFEEIWKSVN